MSRVCRDLMSDTGNALEKNTEKGEERGALERASFIRQLYSRDRNEDPR